MAVGSFQETFKLTLKRHARLGTFANSASNRYGSALVDLHLHLHPGSVHPGHLFNRTATCLKNVAVPKSRMVSFET